MDHFVDELAIELKTQRLCISAERDSSWKEKELELGIVGKLTTLAGMCA